MKKLQWRAGLTALIAAGVLAGGCGDNPQEPAPVGKTATVSEVTGALERALGAARGSDVFDPDLFGDAILQGLSEGGGGAQNDFATGASTGGGFDAGASTTGEFGTGSTTSGEFGTGSGFSFNIGSTSLEGSGSGVLFDFIDVLELFSFAELVADPYAIADRIRNEGIPVVSPGSTIDVQWNGTAPEWEFAYFAVGIDASGNLEGFEGDDMLVGGTSTSIDIPDYSYFGIVMVIVYPYDEMPGELDFSQVQFGFALIMDQSFAGSLLP